MDGVQVETTTESHPHLDDPLHLETFTFSSKGLGTSVSLSRAIHADTRRPVCSHLHSTEEYAEYLRTRTPDQSLCSQCQTGLLIEVKRKTPEGEEIDVPIEAWTRNAVNFYTDASMDISSIPDSTKDLLSVMCQDLEQYAQESFKPYLFPLKIVIAYKKSTPPVVCGFGLYSEVDTKEYAVFEIMRDAVSDGGLYPPIVYANSTPGVSPMRIAKFHKTLYRIAMSAPKFADSCTKAPALSTNVGLLTLTLNVCFNMTAVEWFENEITKEYPANMFKKDQLKELVKWMSKLKKDRFDPVDIEDDEKVACIYLHLICVDPALKSYGIAKGLMRHMGNLARSLALFTGTKSACIRLFPAEEVLRLMYRSMGFEDEPANDSKSRPHMRTFDLMGLGRWNVSEPVEPVRWKDSFDVMTQHGYALTEESRSVIPVFEPHESWKTATIMHEFLHSLPKAKNELLYTLIELGSQATPYPYAKFAGIHGDNETIGVMVYSFGPYFRVQGYELFKQDIDFEGTWDFDDDPEYGSLITLLMNLALKYENDNAEEERQNADDPTDPEHHVYHNVNRVLKPFMRWYTSSIDIEDNLKETTQFLIGFDWTKMLGFKAVDPRRTYEVLIKMIVLENTTKEAPECIKGCIRFAATVSIRGAIDYDYRDARVVLDVTFIKPQDYQPVIKEYAMTSLDGGHYITENLIAKPGTVGLDTIDTKPKKRLKQ